MPYYDIKCKKCNFFKTWDCSISHYEKAIKDKCPECGKKTLYQFMGRSNIKIIYGPNSTTGWSTKKGRLGSQHELDRQLKINDNLHNEPKKNEKWKRHNEKIERQAKKVGLN